MARVVDVEHDVLEAAQDHLKDWAGYICVANLFAGPAPIRKFIAACPFACLLPVTAQGLVACGGSATRWSSPKSSAAEKKKLFRVEDLVMFCNVFLKIWEKFVPFQSV